MSADTAVGVEQSETLRGRPGRPRQHDMTTREIQVFRLVAYGLSNKEIATELDLAELTIKSHLRRIMKKTGTDDRAAIVTWGYRQGYFQRLRVEPRPDIQPLTDREAEMVRWVIKGYSNKEIGRAVFLSEQTVKTHLRKAFKKVGARSRAHIITLAWQHNLVPHEAWEEESV